MAEAPRHLRRARPLRIGPLRQGRGRVVSACVQASPARWEKDRMM